MAVYGAAPLASATFVWRSADRLSPLMTQSSHRILSAAGTAVGLHTVAFFLSQSYRAFTFDVGGLFSHATDIADLPRLGAIGFVVLGVSVVAGSVLLERWLWWLRDDPPPRR